MASGARDPYETLGITASASDKELRAAYKRLVQLHHPDHNGGSPEAARRFEEVQEAYARVKQLRAGSPKQSATDPGVGTRGPATDPGVEARMADLERQLREAHRRREQARAAAREAAAKTFSRPSDEELGYITTDDSFSKILADARSEVSERLSGARETPVAKRVEDLIDELEGLLSKATRERRE
jgi:curved DNA-binding protein CbpA